MASGWGGRNLKKSAKVAVRDRRKHIGRRDRRHGDQKTPRQEYGRRVVATLGPAKRPQVPKWRPGLAGTTPNGLRFIVYGGHILAGGERPWRTNNPGNIRIGPFARANGAIGHDGDYAIFPDEFTGTRAILTLLCTPAYGQMTVREVLLRHVSGLEGNIEAKARAKQFGFDANSLVERLDKHKLARLKRAISSTWAAENPRIFAKRSASQTPWARDILMDASAGTNPSRGNTNPAACYSGYPDNWQVGTWYVRQDDGTYRVSPDQDPRHSGAPGMYMRYNGNNSWDVVGRDSDTGPGNTGGFNPSDPNAGNAVPPGQPPPYGYTDTLTRPDGTKFNYTRYPAGATPDNVPENAAVILLSDGSFIVVNNTDGTKWTNDWGGLGDDPSGSGPGTQGDFGGEPGYGGQGGDGGGDGEVDLGGDGGGPGGYEPDPDDTGRAG